MPSKSLLRRRVLSYLVLAAVFAGWFFVSDYLDREQQARIAKLREMHRQGIGPDIDAILSDPHTRRQKRLVDGGLFAVAIVGAYEWKLWRERRREKPAP